MSQCKKKINISTFLNEEGKILQIPVPSRTKMQLLAYLASKFYDDRVYSEKEINEIINQWHTFNDYFILRRLLIDYKLLQRTPDGAKYWIQKSVDNKDNIIQDKEKETE